MTNNTYNKLAPALILRAGVTAWALGRPANMKIRGTKAQITALTEVLDATKLFQAELDRKDANVEAVMEKLEHKRIAAAAFTRVCGIVWPL